MTRLFTMLGLVALVLGSPRVTEAQTPTSYQANYYNVGAATAVQTETFSAASAVCNQTPPAVTSTINPSRIVFTDPINAGKDCIITDPAGGTLVSLPIGATGSNYEGTLQAGNAIGLGPESSPRASFSRGAAPGALTGVLFVR